MPVSHQSLFFSRCDDYLKDVVCTTTTTTINKSTSPTTSKSKVNDWSYLLPSLCIIGIGSVTSPYFAFGLAVGVVAFFIQTITLYLAYSLGIFSLDSRPNTDEYIEWATNHAFFTAIIGPIIEELIFRGAIQPLCITVIGLINPALLLMPFFSTGLNVAVIAGIVCTSLLFGIGHLGSSKNHDNYLHAVMATLGGILEGVLAIKFGLVASIAAHIANNLIVITLQKAAGEVSSKIESDSVHSTLYQYGQGRR